MRRKRTYQEDLPTKLIRFGASCRGDEEAEAAQQLADSLQEHGVLQPLLVRGDGDGGYVCVVGSRRLRAAQLAGLTTVPALVIDGELTDADVLETQLIENVQRADLRPIEQATAYKELMALRGWTQRDLARRLHVNQGTVSRAVSLLGLAPEVQELVEADKLTPAVARVLLDEPPDVQAREAKRLADAGASRAEAQRRLKPQPKTFDLTTPGGWSVLVTAKRSKATRAELLAELAGLVDAMRGGQEDGPRLAA